MQYPQYVTVAKLKFLLLIVKRAHTFIAKSPHYEKGNQRF